eukprot:Protomagalhaensia_sp_Gyna_25__3255@NODE_295_length_4022_cov_94_985438_g228_i0_p1_GENE_NODE_295_length_4022_cov_94_985438_g228_i0NODE_295_length_4022_cov_94_985438_g228_i0_p1_ORF_typecomplete_len512_score45_26Las1/PF04031_13/3_9e14Las1/PF04031_13/9_3e03_NODE_295_length_4022_cov_94_985438_g228_i022813816
MGTLVNDAAVALVCGIEGNQGACEDFLSLASLLMAAPDCPKVTEPTVMLLKGLSLENDQPVSKQAILALAIVRYVDLLSSLNQLPHQPLRSVAAVCTDFGLPEELVEARHKIVHRELPPLSTLIMAATLALEHVVGVFWSQFLATSIAEETDSFSVFIKELGVLLSLFCDVQKQLHLTESEQGHIENLLCENYISSIHTRQGHPLTRLDSGPINKFQIFWEEWRNLHFPKVKEHVIVLRNLIKAIDNDSVFQSQLMGLFTNFLLYSRAAGTLESLFLKYLFTSLLAAAPSTFLDQLALRCILQLRALLKSKTRSEASQLFADHNAWCAEGGGELRLATCFCVNNTPPAIYNLVSWLNFFIEPDPKGFLRSGKVSSGKPASADSQLDLSSTTIVLLFISQHPQALLRLTKTPRVSTGGGEPEDIHAVLRDIDLAVAQLQTRLLLGLGKHFMQLSAVYVDLVARSSIEPQFHNDKELQSKIWKVLGLVQAQRLSKSYNGFRLSCVDPSGPEND